MPLCWYHVPQTGFVIWINGKGVMVDPPPHSSLLLRMMGIPPRLIDTLILTHCHADHDAGTLQKVLEEGQVTIMATKTVIGSFVAKYVHAAAVCVCVCVCVCVLRVLGPVRLDCHCPLFPGGHVCAVVR